jgi:type I restriction enzyme S subunit
MVNESKEVARARLIDAGVEALPDDWDVVTLGDLFTEDRGIAVGVMYPGDHDPAGVPLIKAGDLNGSIINPQPDFRISREKHREYRRTTLEGGELLMTLVGNVGQCAVVPQRMAGWNVARAVAVMRLANVSDTYFAQQCLLSRPLKHLMDVWSNTTVQATLNLKEIRQLPLPWPPKKCRDAIAGIGKALDDKIELNRRTNATLEAMARALFKSWFVDFDPVRAKLDGRAPVGLDPATAALFPDSFQESSLGEIPKGWEEGKVVESFNLTMGQSPPGDTYNEEGNGLPFYQGRTDFGFRFPTRRIYCSAPTRFAKTGDTLVSVRAPVGDINMAYEDCCIGRGVAAVRHKSDAISFTYQSMTNLYPELARFEAEGTVFGSINKDSFQKLRFVAPPTELIAAYEHQTRPIDEQIRILGNQSRTLVTLRDTLLPKLLSGELRVAEMRDLSQAAD